MKMTTKFSGILFWIVVLFLSRTALAEPSSFSGISYFRADVSVRTDATLEVREEIVVRDAATFYKWGFRRDLPISPQERWDLKYVGAFKPDNGVRVKILEVTEDGSPARYERGRGYGYPQVSIGERNVPLDSGEHRFVIRYTVESAMKVGPPSDTLYWNAIGNDRTSPVGEAIVAVHLPAGVSIESVTADPRVGGRGVGLPRGPET